MRARPELRNRHPPRLHGHPGAHVTGCWVDDCDVVLCAEVNWAHHLSLNAVVVPGPRAGRHANLAQRLSQLVRSVHSTSVWVRYRLTHGDASCKVRRTTADLKELHR